MFELIDFNGRISDLGIFPLVLKNLLTLAEFFSRTDEFWLAERFYKQSLEVVEKNPDLDREFGAESCLKFGQALENRCKENFQGKIVC